MALYSCNQNTQNTCAGAQTEENTACGCGDANAVGGASTPCGCAQSEDRGALLLFIALILLLIVLIS